MTTTTFPNSATRELLQEWVDIPQIEARVGAALVDLGDTSTSWMHFLLAYAFWNGRVANGVSSLAAFIGEQKNLFKDPHLPNVVADRSNYIASFVFDAAREEYDDQMEHHRDTRRCLGQATIMGAAQYFGIDLASMQEPQWLHAFHNSVRAGYLGLSPLAIDAARENLLPAELLHRIFQGMGYHLGNELLADREFSILDTFLRTQQPALVSHLLGFTTAFAGGKHRGYAWIGLHNSTSGEAPPSDQHFQHALQGVNEALALIPAHLTDECMLALRHGFMRFASDHEHFFHRAGQVLE